MAQRPLPDNVDAALAAIAKGWTREPTTAHPDCTCKLQGGIVEPESRSACKMHGKVT